MSGRPIKRTLRHPGLSDASEGTGVPESRGEVGVQDPEHMTALGIPDGEMIG